MSLNPAPDAPALRPGILAASALSCAGLLAIALLYQFRFEFDCRASLPRGFCAALSLAIPRGLCAAGLLGLLLSVRPGLRVRIAAALRRDLAPVWPMLTALGFGLMMVPWIWVRVEAAQPSAPVMALFWSGGLLAVLTGGIFTLASPGALWVALRANGLEAALALLAGLLFPDLALATQSLWNLEPLSRLTFSGVINTLTFLDQSVTSDPATRLIGIGAFEVRVGKQCSGVEGFALITLFTAFFLWLFRDRLDLRRAWVLFPVGLVLSWGLNVVRISGLVLLGRYHSPDLAVNGFHSNAGWLMFLGLALGMAVASNQIRWLRRSGNGDPVSTRAAEPAFRGETTALILPFAVFMASAALAPALIEVPAVAYPVRLLVTGAVLALNAGFLRRLTWRADPGAILAGLVCGGLWVVSAPDAAASDLMLLVRLNALPPFALFLWVVARLLGTVILVPILEEAFFRGYVLQKLLGSRPVSRLFAIAVSALLFGVLHDRILAASLAGLLFGAVYLRRRSLSDAILCHACANAVIAAVAVHGGSWHLI